MKREITHRDCKPSPRGLSRDDDPIDAVMRPLEPVRHVRGRARGSYHCDVCGAEIEQDSPATASSYGQMNEYMYSWEHDYIAED